VSRRGRDWVRDARPVDISIVSLPRECGTNRLVLGFDCHASGFDRVLEVGDKREHVMLDQLGSVRPLVHDDGR
jgi:hypothetical protein